MSEHLEHSVATGHADVGYDHAEPSGRPLFLLTAIAAITVVVLIAGVTVFFNYVEEDAVHDKILVPQADNLVSLHAREDKQLYTYQFIDRAKGAVQLPIDRAMELVIKESGEGKLPFPQKATPVVPDAATAPPAAPAPNAAPAK
jgi:hypothetical protein